MKKNLLLLLLLCSLGITAQTYEVGLFGGGANMIGDVGSTSYISPSGPAFGAIFKWNKSKRYAWRATAIYGKYTADDSKSSMDSRVERGFEISNSLFEVSAGLEINFVEYNLHQLGPAFTPYMYSGLTYFRYDFKHFAGTLVDDNQRDGSLAIPMILGAKYRLSQFFVLGAEIGARYTFTDNLDGSNPEDTNFENFKFGNILSNDWYVFSGITLTYTFGKKRCKDCFE